MAHPRILWRGLRVLGHLLTGAILAAAVRLVTRLGRRPTQLPALVRWWHARLIVILGIRVQVRGQPAPGCLLVGNHISWLDIPIIGAQGEIQFLAKSDVRRWPLVGWLAETADTLFIERGAYQTSARARQLSERIGSGGCPMIFPEGTTSDGTRVLPFHPRLFALAQDGAVAIQPVALTYRCRDGTAPDPIAPFVGDDRLIAHLPRVLRHPGLVAELQFLPPLETGRGQRRRAIAERSRQAILSALGLDATSETTRRHPTQPREVADAA